MAKKQRKNSKSSAKPAKESVSDTSGSDDLIRFVDGWRPRSILVVGDFMLDHYIYGDAERLSPDAPVPVLAIQREEYKPGGAANVCLALCALKCRVKCLGVVGNDDEAKMLGQSLRQAGCNVTGLIRSSDRPTTIKHNFVGLAQHRHPQKMFRVDQESTAPIPKKISDQILSKVEALLDKADVLCLEDYHKGVLTEALCKRLIKLAKRKGVVVLVDPASKADYQKYRGATCLTPNRTEAEIATGIARSDRDDQAPKAMSQKLLNDLDLKAVVLTLDKQGALLQEKGKAPIQVPTQARQVYDVTGAGDMVLAMLAGAIANGADWHTAVRLANTAAGLEVEHFGVVAVPLEEVLLSLLREQHQVLGKERTVEQLLPELAAYRKQGKRIAFTNGCFDILHAGHIAMLRAARNTGDLLVVGLNSDKSIRRLKGKDRPVNRQCDRMMVLSELESIDYIIVFDQDTPIKLIKKIKPDVLVKGGDYSKQQVIGADLVEATGGRVVLVDVVKGLSTTKIVHKLSKPS
jgi:D-beta-D-heptose 7-phosphate kinase/D-beta-D-heptose 1-phosphate adenosyltransferase